MILFMIFCMNGFIQKKTYSYLGVQEDLQLNWGNYRDVKRGILPWSAVEVLALQMFVTSQVEAPHPLDSLSPFDCSGTDSKISWPQISAVICRKKRRSNKKNIRVRNMWPWAFLLCPLCSGVRGTVQQWLLDLAPACWRRPYGAGGIGTRKKPWQLHSPIGWSTGNLHVCFRFPIPLVYFQSPSLSSEGSHMSQMLKCGSDIDKKT